MVSFFEKDTDFLLLNSLLIGSIDVANNHNNIEPLLVDLKPFSKSIKKFDKKTTYRYQNCKKYKTVLLVKKKTKKNQNRYLF